MVKEEQDQKYTHQILQDKINLLSKKKQEKILNLICSFYSVRRIVELTPANLKAALNNFEDFKIIA